VKLGKNLGELFLVSLADIRPEPQGVAGYPRFDDAIQADEGSAADEEDIRRIYFQVF
jgi:hypothetical protein